MGSDDRIKYNVLMNAARHFRDAAARGNGNVAAFLAKAAEIEEKAFSMVKQ